MSKEPHPFLARKSAVSPTRGSPFDVPDTATEALNQGALFLYLNMVSSWGLEAAHDPRSYHTRQGRGWAERIHAASGLGYADHKRYWLDMIYAVPNGLELAGGGRAGGMAKHEGLRPGIPDICVPVAMRGFHSYYIELKAPNGRPSPEQIKMHARLIHAGHRVEIKIGWRIAAKAILTYLEI
jgi:hypothetical protein